MKLPRKTKVEKINMQLYAYLTENGEIVSNPEIGQEYVVLMKISGG